MKLLLFFLLLLPSHKIFCQIKEDSLLKVIDGLKNDLSKAKTLATGLKNDNQVLSERLSEIDKELPAIRRCSNSKTTENDLYLTFELSKLGRIKVSVYDGINSTPVDSAISIYDQFPKFHFIKLAPDKKFYVRAVVMDQAGKEKKGSIYDYKSDPENLTVKTKYNVPNPALILVNKAKASPDKIEIAYRETNGQKVALGYICEKLITLDDGTVIKEKVEAKEADLDVNGNLIEATAAPAIKISKLEPETNYFVTVKALNETGKSQLYNYSIKTPEVTKELQFVGGIFINYNPIETVIAWKVNKKPNNPAVTIKSSDGKTKFTQDADYKNDSCFVKLNYSQFQQMINANDGSSKKIPLIVASMTDENNVLRSIELRISYTLPSKEDISKNTEIAGAAKETLTAAVTEVSEAVSGNKKIKWEKLLQLGLPLLLGIL